jgi:polysaccharide biosynthesis protein PslG
MRRVVLIAILLTFLTPSAALAAHRKVPTGWLGVVADGPMTEPAFPSGDEWNRLAGSGAESVRTAFYWYAVQPAGPRDADFTATDATMAAAISRGLSVLPVLQGTPTWAAQNPGDPGSPPANPASFAAYLKLLVTRYGPHGSFWAEHPELPARPVRAWQIWNEPNIPRYWNVPDWAPPYVKLLKAAHAALRHADRGGKIVLAGLPNESWEALHRIYRAGARHAFDVVALHPYTSKPSNVIKLIRLSRAEMRRRGDRKLPVWITELSWPASVGKVQNGVRGFQTTDAGQGSRLRRGLGLLVKDRRSLRIGRVYWYTWLSQEAATGSSFDYSGLRRIRDGQIIDAPALGAFTHEAKKLEGCAKLLGNAARCR